MKKGRLYYSQKYECYNAKPLEAEDILTLLQKKGTKCFYCNRQTVYKSSYRYKKVLLTLDRIDNSKSHIIDNCVVACYDCNTMRGNVFSSKHFKNIKNRLKYMK
jgi:5-methylcytosine-specific restriction endonuclease McrA